MNIILGIITLSLIAVFIRLILGKTVWEKLLSLNLIAIHIIMLIITYAVSLDSILIIDIAIAYSIIGFLALILLTRFIGGRNDS